MAGNNDDSSDELVTKTRALDTSDVIVPTSPAISRYGNALKQLYDNIISKVVAYSDEGSLYIDHTEPMWEHVGKAIKLDYASESIKQYRTVGKSIGITSFLGNTRNAGWLDKLYKPTGGYQSTHEVDLHGQPNPMRFVNHKEWKKACSNGINEKRMILRLLGKLCHHYLELAIRNRIPCKPKRELFIWLPEYLFPSFQQDYPREFVELLDLVSCRGYTFLSAEYPLFLPALPVKDEKDVLKFLVGIADLIAWHPEHGLVILDWKFVFEGRACMATNRSVAQLHLLAQMLKCLGIMVNRIGIVTVNTDYKTKWKVTFHTYDFDLGVVHGILSGDSADRMGLMATMVSHYNIGQNRSENKHELKRSINSMTPDGDVEYAMELRGDPKGNKIVFLYTLDTVSWGISVAEDRHLQRIYESIPLAQGQGICFYGPVLSRTCSVDDALDILIPHMYGASSANDYIVRCEKVASVTEVKKEIDDLIVRLERLKHSSEYR
jgi:hypothetical protein